MNLLQEEALLSMKDINVPELLARAEINLLIQSPVEVVGFSDEEGIR